MNGTHIPMQPTDLQLLRSVRHDVKTHLASAATNTAGQIAARMVDNTLGYLIAKLEDGVAPLKREVEAQLPILRDLVAIARESAIPVPERAQWFDEAKSLDLSALEADEFRSLHRDVNELLENLVAALNGAGAEPGAKARPHVLKLVAITQASQDAALATGEAERQRMAQAFEAAMSPLTVERVDAYLKARFPDRPGIRVKSLQALAGGFSKTSVLLDIEGLEEGATALVLKRDMRASATETTVLAEIPVITAVRAAGLPVPEVLWAEPDGSKLGYPFMVMRRIEGVIGGTLFQPGPNVTVDTCKDLARFLAKFHAIDPAGIDLGPHIDATLDPAAQERHVIAELRGFWDRVKLFPDPVLEATFNWLERNQPPAPKRVSMLHSDIGFHNMLLKGDRLSAVLDWEMVQLGSASMNLAYVRPQIEAVMKWDDFLAEYRAHGGGAYDESVEPYYRTWRDVRNTVGAAACHYAFCSDRNMELRMGHTGIIDYRTILLMSARVL